MGGGGMIEEPLQADGSAKIHSRLRKDPWAAGGIPP
jgi:hypothetical protein